MLWSSHRIHPRSASGGPAGEASGSGAEAPSSDFDFGIDPSLHPGLAMVRYILCFGIAASRQDSYLIPQALRMSLEEERARKAASSPAAAAAETSTLPPIAESAASRLAPPSSAPPPATAEPTSKTSDDAYVYNDEESLLAQALGLSKEAARMWTADAPAKASGSAQQRWWQTVKK